MVNPLRGFISPGYRLFEEIDEAGNGIGLYRPGGVSSFLATIVDVLLGRAISVTVGGDTVTVDRFSAERFFARNADKFHGILHEGMSVQKKLLRLLNFSQQQKAGVYLSGLPRGLFEEVAGGGEEGKKLVIGMVSQFSSLIDALEKNNGFKLSALRERVTESRESGYLRFDREELFALMATENADRLSELNAESGRPEVCKVAALIIARLRACSKSPND